MTTNLPAQKNAKSHLLLLKFSLTIALLVIAIYPVISQVRLSPPPLDRFKINKQVFDASLKPAIQKLPPNITTIGTWTQVTALAPDANDGVCLLLSDGRVLCHSIYGSGDSYDILTPDIHGSYINGTWSRAALTQRWRTYFGSVVLKDGRVYVGGGEYGTDGTGNGSHAQVYDPVTNTWSAETTPGHVISDGGAEILPDGRVLQAMVYDGLNIKHTAIFDPVSNSWAGGPDSHGIHSESMWLKLPDNSILMVDMQRLDNSYTFTTPAHSERYIPSSNTWVVDADVPVDLFDPYAFETGPALLLPDGRAFFIGSSGHTAYYTPSGTTSPGTWAAGPDLPNGTGMPDGPCAMMVNGKILFACSPIPISGELYRTPTYWYEFDYLTNAYTQINASNGELSIDLPCYAFVLLNLPDGSVLSSQGRSTTYYVYTPAGGAISAGKPLVSGLTQTSCYSYRITGTGFNGISEGSAYNDENMNATNYPLVRLTSGSNVYYARTFNWNSTGVARGSAPDTANFVLPAGLPNGTYSLVVIANGIASDPINLDVAPSNILYVNANASAAGIHTGQSWSNAFTTLQDALNNCPTVTQIWVAKGTYYPDEGGGQSDNNRNATFTLKNGVAIYGGFAGTETALSQRNLKINATILSGDIDKDNTLTNNAYHVTTASATNSTAVIDGFTITGGNASDNGGGMLNNSGSPIISNCTFSGNRAANGGGLYNNTASPTITNCIFSGNAASNLGGAMSNGSSSLSLINCTISGNVAGGGGGGGIYSLLGSGTITNCIFWNNKDVNGIGTSGSSIFNFASSLTISYSLVQGQNPGGTGNLDGTNAANNPLFVTPVDPLTAPTTAGDLHLQPGSTVIDAGSDAANATTTDRDGTIRKVDIIPGGSLIDMGAYEANPVPHASIADKSITEGNSGTTLMKFKVTLDHAYGGTVKIKYATADSTATAGSDYVAAQGTVSIKPGKISKIISITINGDATKEANERFKVKLSKPSNALLLDSLGIGTIRNDEAAAFTSTSTVNESKVAEVVSVKVFPEPNKGTFTIQMQLPAKEAATTLTLYNSLGIKVWQQDMGSISGAATKNVYLENKLTAGVYTLAIQRGDTHYTTKIVVGK